MKKLLTTCCVLLFCIVNLLAQTVTLTFTGVGANGHNLQMDSVSIVNLTRGWQETLLYPDTVLTMTNNVGIEDMEAGAFMLSQNMPNPFEGKTSFSLQLTENDNVYIEVFDLTGKLITSFSKKLEAGVHNFNINLATPQTYLLNAKSGKHSASIKMMNYGSDGINAIEYVGGYDVNTLSFKSQTTNPFVYGDLMEYVGFVTVDGDVYESDRIMQQQGTSQTFSLQFSVSQIPTGSLVPVFFAPLTSNTQDVISGATGQTYGTLGSYTSNGLEFQDGYVSFSTGCWQQFNYNTPFTIIFDYQRDASVSGQHMTVVSTCRGTETKGLHCYCHNGALNKVRVGLINSGVSSVNTTVAMDSTSLLHTFHVKTGFIYDGNGTLIQIQDGVITNHTLSFTTSTFPSFAGLPFSIGGFLNYYLDRWIGTIRNVRIYDYALSQKELDTIE